MSYAANGNKIPLDLRDTNPAIYYLQQQFPSSPEVFIDSILPDSNPAISVITEIELLCWKTATDKDLEILQNLIKLFL